jgi:hypothetical protein
METQTRKDDAPLALVRHALMAAAVENGTWYTRPIVSRMSARQPEEPISAESRAQYDYELLECAGRLMDDGRSQSEADALALDAMGCVEFWEYASAHPLPSRRSFFTGAKVRHADRCARCESIGHEVEACPFVDDAQTRKIAMLRRERRSEKAKAA